MLAWTGQPGKALTERSGVAGGHDEPPQGDAFARAIAAGSDAPTSVQEIASDASAPRHTGWALTSRMLFFKASHLFML